MLRRMLWEGEKGLKKRDPLNPTWGFSEAGGEASPSPPLPSPHTYHKRAQGAPCVPGEGSTWPEDAFHLRHPHQGNLKPPSLNSSPLQVAAQDSYLPLCSHRTCCGFGSKAVQTDRGAMQAPLHSLLPMPPTEERAQTTGAARAEALATVGRVMDLIRPSYHAMDTVTWFRYSSARQPTEVPQAHMHDLLTHCWAWHPSSMHT